MIDDPDTLITICCRHCNGEGFVRCVSDLGDADRIITCVPCDGTGIDLELEDVADGH